MKQIWLNRQNNSKLIVFFNGWGMDEKIVQNLLFDDFDVLSICDYTKLEPIEQDFSKYKNKYLVCWSMGVLIANEYCQIFKDFDKRIAINGTPKPIDDNFGIPENVYNLMIENYNNATTAKFIKKMTMSNILGNYVTRNDIELKQELISIKDLKTSDYLNFDRVITSRKDRIIPFKNQMNYWKTQNITVEELELPHYIFDKYKKWSELI